MEIYRTTRQIQSGIIYWAHQLNPRIARKNMQYIGRLKKQYPRTWHNYFKLLN